MDTVGMVGRIRACDVKIEAGVPHEAVLLDSSVAVRRGESGACSRLGLEMTGRERGWSDV